MISPFDNEFGLRSSRLNPFAPKVLRKNYGGGDIGLAAAAAIQAASAAASWLQALALPAIQAAANIQLMAKQKADYQQIVTQQRQLLGTAVNNYVSAIDGVLSSQDFENAYPDVPQAAEYVPVDVCCVQGATIECNISHLPRAGVYVSAADELKRQEGFTTAIAFDPRFLEGVDMMSIQISDMLRGKADVGDVVDIIADSAEAALATGRIGGNRRMVARNLGLTRRSLQAEGRREFARHQQMMNNVVLPHGRRATMEDYMQTPAQRIAYALTQAQIIQSSLQNLYNRNAQKDPYKLAELTTKMNKILVKLQFEANKATLVNQFVPNYAAVLQPQIRSVAQAIGDSIPSASKTHYYGNPGTQDGSYSLPRNGGGSSTTIRSGATVDENEFNGGFGGFL